MHIPCRWYIHTNGGRRWTAPPPCDVNCSGNRASSGSEEESSS